MFAEKKRTNAPVLLVAGCGDLGTRVAEQCARDGWSVYGLRRDIQQLPGSIRPLAGDLALAERPLDWPESAIDYVLYAVAAERRDEASYRQAYVTGLRHVLAWLEQGSQRPQRIFFVSSTAVYGQADGQWVDEQSPTLPTGFNGRILLEAEQLLAQQGLANTTVRLAGLYGAERQALLQKVVAGYRVVPEPVHFSNRIHREDAAGLLLHLLQCAEQGRALDSCYLGVDDQPVALAEVVDWLRSELGVECSLPAEQVRGVGSKRCTNARAKATGWRLRYPSYQAGYRERLQGVIR